MRSRASLMGGAASAEISDNVVRVGVLNDISGIFWLDVEGVDAIVDVPNSAVGLSINTLLSGLVPLTRCSA